jgi:flagellar basal-body rod protein FlgC
MIMSLSRVFDIAGSAMSVQTVRLNTTASNIANAEAVSSSTGETYRARQPIFRAQYTNALGDGTGLGGPQVVGVEVAGVVESQAPLQKRFEPEHPYADDQGFVAYPNVNIVEEMANMISASRSFQTGADMTSTVKQMFSQVLALGQ